MGMFDYVKFKKPCSKCGSDNVIFQSKAGNCTLDTVEPYTLNWFKGYCGECRNIDYYEVKSTILCTVADVAIELNGEVIDSTEYVGKSYTLNIHSD
jgi:hypothetical protein